MHPVIIIGAGPCGLSAAVELSKRGIRPLLLEKGCLTHSIYRYPTMMHFFSTPELLEIGDIPFTTANEKPSRHEALHYYRHVASKYQLDIRTYEQVESVEAGLPHFLVRSRDRFGHAQQYSAQRVVIATGYFDRPNLLNVPGEQLPKVSHYYKDARPYQGMKVAVIGGKNSAIEAAMELERTGAEVTLIYRRAQLTPSVKPWVRPLFDSLVAKQRIRVLWETEVVSISADSLTVQTNGMESILANDFVFALTGYHPDRQLLQSLDIQLREDTGAPLYDETTMETTVPGLYIAGVLAAGRDANVIFIENGRFHGGLLAEHIAGQIAAARPQ